MARDEGLEMLIADALEGTSGVTTKAMFGGLAYMLRGHLTFGARKGSLLVRLGKGNDAWALAIDGITQMASGKRAMPGWVRAAPVAYGDDKLRAWLFAAALALNAALPPKGVD